MNFQESSRKNWTSDRSVEHINAGSLQRIADAMEKVALNYDELLRDKKRAEEARDYWRNRADRLASRVSALKGVITKMRNHNTNRRTVR